MVERVLRCRELFPRGAVAKRSRARKECGPRRLDRSGPRCRLQLRFTTDLTSDEYVRQQAWRHASLEACPWHDDGCRIKRHGTYERKEPPGAKVARWYCADAQATVSLLPDCLCAKLPGSLEEAEKVAVTVEESDTVEAAADELRPDVEMYGRLPWVRRRLRLVYAGLVALRTMLPDIFGECVPTVSAMREHLGVGSLLPLLRAIGAAFLQVLPPPLGFGPRPKVSLSELKRQQHWALPRAPPSLP